MDKSQTTKKLKSLLTNPSDLADIIQNPGHNGLEFYRSLSNKEKQYLAFAAAAGLVAYGIYLGRK